MLNLSLRKGSRAFEATAEYPARWDMQLHPYLGTEQRQNTSAAADVEHNFVLKEKGIIHNCVHVSPRPDAVLEHLLMDA